MKHDWEYKKLGEVAPIICGKDYKSVLQENGQYPIYGSGGIMGYASEYRCPENCTIVGRKGSINNPLFVTTKFWNVDTAFGLNPKLDYINPKYLYYFCTNFDFNTLNVAVTLPSLRRTDVENILISLPPLPTQQSIVSELDSLSKIIADCKETLKDYDALEQSIFYDMFGDPVKNDKGWEVKKWSDVLNIINGKNQKAVECENGDYPIYGSGGIMSYASDWLCPENCTIIGRKGNINKPIFVTTKFWNVDTAFGLNADKTQLEPIFLYYFCVIYDFEKHNKAVTIPSLTKADLLTIQMPVPPLPLQQQFASKIEAIEKMKAETKKALQEAETLFNARMDYWFN